MERLIVVGGGVVGLMTAALLAEEGGHVTLLDRGKLGGEASWAGGGIVSPLFPWRYSPAITALANWSQDYYPELARRLFVHTGVDPQVCRTGLYWLDLEDEPAAVSWAQHWGKPLIQLESAAVAKAVPQIGRGFERALYSEDVANVRNPRLLQALRIFLKAKANVVLREQLSVSGFVFESGRVRGVIADGVRLLADRVILAAGAWSGSLMEALGFHLPVGPVKGQMLLYKCSESFLSTMVLARGRYVIPRQDGHVLVGSTLEYVGFDKTPTMEALESLKDSAEGILPALADADLVGHWAGLRPGSPGGIPFIGEISEYPGLWLNCGHYRNGLVLAPASCRLLMDLMMSRKPIIDPAPYSPARLGCGSVDPEFF